MTIDLLDGMGTTAATDPRSHEPLPVRFTPSELAGILGEKNRPTPEQASIIESPLTPRLVIAGAGSGKTATMADRVVWLVANGWVRPEEVLGVTFTRKAAGELASRIRAKLATLQRIAAEDDGRLGFPESLANADDLEPKVSTYHSYASSIVSDYGLRLGIERDVVLLGAPSRGNWPARPLRLTTVPSSISRPLSPLLSMPSSSSRVNVPSISGSRTRCGNGSWKRSGS